MRVEALRGALPSAASLPRSKGALLSVILALGFLAISLRIAVPAVENELRYRSTDLPYFLGAGLMLKEGDGAYIYERPWPQEVRDYVQQRDLRLPGGYAYTPLTAFAAIPLVEEEPRGLASEIAEYAVLTAVAITGLCVASSFQGWHWRIAILVAAFAWQPLIFSIRFAQTGAFGAAIAAMGYLLFSRSRPAGAALLGLIIFKPTLAVGPGLAMLGGKRRNLLIFAASCFALGVLPILLLGGLDAFTGWLRILLDRGESELGGGGHKYSAGISKSLDLTSGAGYATVVFVGAAVAALAFMVGRRLGPYEAGIFGIVAALVLNPHALLYDWGIVFVTIMLVRKASLGRLSTDLGAGIFGIVLFAVGQWSWDVIDSRQDVPIQPLTLWSLTVAGSLAALAFWHPRAPDGAGRATETAD